MNESLFSVVGEWIAGTRLDDVPVAARDVAKHAILDCIGVTVAGRQTPVGDILTHYLQPASAAEATLVAREERAAAEMAAFANAAQGHALDFDDCNASLGGHPSVVVLPAALAVAEQRRASGRDLFEAYVLGFEVAAKIGRALNFWHYERGWHPTATIGVFGAVAAAAKLSGLDAGSTATALSIGASTAAGMKANFGTATKPLQVGRAAQNGVFAARLAEVGADANPGAFEHEQGYAELFNGPGSYDIARTYDAMGQVWDLLDPGLVIKRYPCCASTHGAVDSAVALRDQIEAPDAIEAVQIYLHPRRLRHTNRPVVSTGFEGKFSVQYVVARALLHGPIGLSDFSPAAIEDAGVRRLMSRVTADPMPQDRWGADHFPAEVEVRLPDGRVLQKRTERPRGNGPEHALSDAELETKFLDCCSAGGFGSEQATQIAKEIAALDDIDDPAHLFALLRPESSPPR